jgi:hypothetical protein
MAPYNKRMQRGVRRQFSLAYNVLPKFAALRKGITVKLNIESEREDDGRWLAEVPSSPEFLRTARVVTKR